MTSCQDLLEMSNNDTKFLNKIVTGDESLCFAFDPESKLQSATSVGPNSSKAKFRFQKSHVKTILVAFFDSRGLNSRGICSC